MIAPKKEWSAFIDEEDRLCYYRRWNLISPKATAVKPVLYSDNQITRPTLCDIVGHQGDGTAVVSVGGQLGCIHGEYLAELQPRVQQKLPRGTSFVEVLSHYVVIDIETTGFSWGADRVIEFAAAKYVWGERTDAYHTLINPGKPIPKEITDLTGIRQNDVQDAPTLEAVQSTILAYIGDLPIIGHNAVSFDVPFLSRQMGVQLDNAVVDTLPLSRSVFTLLRCHKLAYLNHALALKGAVSHRALADVETTNELLWACLSPRAYESKVYAAALQYMDGQVEQARRKETKPQKVVQAARPRDIRPTVEQIDPQNPLYGRRIVFTGCLTIAREEAMHLAVNAGGVVASSISGKTDYLVVGAQDRAIVGDDGNSSQEEKARAFNAAGKADIKIIKEKDFMSLLGKEAAAI